MSDQVVAITDYRPKRLMTQLALLIRDTVISLLRYFLMVLQEPRSCAQCADG